MSRASIRTAERRQSRRSSPRRRGAVTVLASIMLVVIAAAAWVGIRGFLAKGELEAGLPFAGQLKGQLVSGDVVGAQSSARSLAEHARAAAELTDDPIWRAAELVPWVGPNLLLMRELTASADDVTQSAVLPLSALTESIGVSNLKPTGGRIDLQPLIDSQEVLAQSSMSVDAALGQIDSLESAGTLEVLSNAKTRFRGYLDEASAGLSVLSDASRLLPTMLGAEGQRNYLVLFQNNAELRSTGGIPGAMAIVEADGGAIKLVQQASTTEFDKFAAPVIELPAETLALYGPNTAQYVQDVNFTPDFALSGEIAQEMWSQKFGLKVDGVISLDPVALSYMLRASGAVELPTGDQLSSDNAVQLLLRDVYVQYPDPDDQDAYFAAAAAAVFDKIATGNMDPIVLVEALVQASDERRVLIWSDHDQEQQVLAATNLAGGLPVSTQTEQRFGLYFNDSTTAKMDPYLQVDIAAGRGECRQDGLPLNSLQVTLTNTAPSNAGEVLPEYVTGSGEFSVPQGHIRTNVAAYGAPGLFNLGVARDGVRVPSQAATDSGYGVSKVEIELAPGDTTTFDFQFLGNDTLDRTISVQNTPFVYPLETSELVVDCANDLG